ncbi:hypothetical protein IFM89_034470 [Coptis chinensis]|uniref:Glutamate receptor n=1 Tax=Coptis chinensis TaxID=261450 RepID=A0A835IYP5_9MAGN|nr:hypothetical protein IFM89_034470 [Coptis chinensis]
MTSVDLIKNVQVQAILGPQTSSEAVFVVDIGNKTEVPIISFSATSPSISFTKTSYFIRTTLNDSTQVKAIAAIIDYFGWREVVPIYEDTDYGKDMIPYLIDAIQDVNSRVPYRSVLCFSPTDEQIRGELYKLMTMQTRVFVVHMRTSLGSRFFSIANEVGMMSNGYVWIITDGLTDLLSSIDTSIIGSMQGVLGIKAYVPRSEKLDNFRRRWKRKFLQDNPDIDEVELSVLGLYAYDSFWALAMAVEKLNTVRPLFKRLDNGTNTTDLENLGISENGPKLRDSILHTKFQGLSGEFWLKDGQLQSSTFKIMNIIGKGEREIGFWSPTHGLSGNSDLTTKTSSQTNLGAIIWPGETTVIPKGWEMPTSERKLKVGVPKQDGFSDFVKVEKDQWTNATLVTGFCIDVFKAVVDSMKYALPYEFVPFEKADGESAGDYNELVDQVYFQNYDAVVGDVTILANRSNYVDFTLPFTDSGVSMVVPVKYDNRKNAWIFLKPLTTDLWLTTGTFFIYTGFVIWVLEHGINKAFRGKFSQQVGMIFYFSFSTLVFAHSNFLPSSFSTQLHNCFIHESNEHNPICHFAEERIISNFARFVMIIWVFVVLILTSSYTASLTSMLTVQQLQPTITDISDLKKNGDYVGYLSGSFVYGLAQSMGIDSSKLRPYDNVEEFHQALSKGSRNGGVSAVIDEIPYMKLLLAKYCTKYMMVGPTHRTAGFGFVFPKGSPLVPDISRAILNVTEGDKMEAIDSEWFGQQVSCQEQGTTTSESLTLDSFKGLFMIAGVASAIAFIVFFIIFLYEHRNIITSECSVSQKISAMAVEFDKEKDISSRGSKKIRFLYVCTKCKDD